MPYLSALCTQAGPFAYSQHTILDFMVGKMGLDEVERRKWKFLYDRSGIARRHSVLSDFDTNGSVGLYGHGQAPDVQTRMAAFERLALPMAKGVAEKCFDGPIARGSITHLIAVSCTGLSAPGLDIQLVKALQLPTSISRSSINFMGCYAGIHGLKHAWQIAQSESDAHVLVVSVELCTLHFQQVMDDDNTMANLLFADGAASVIVSSRQIVAGSAKVCAFHSELMFSGEKDMAWQVTDKGFLMSLSGYVPKLIAADIKSYYHAFLSKVALTDEDVDYWAIHPGGKAILDGVRTQMSLRPTQIEASYEVLKQYGNMSSATVFFVLEEILQKQGEQGARIMATAFGPGLTMESVLLEKQ